MEKPLSIGSVAKAAGCKVPTIRYYEDIGLLPPPERSRGNQRLFSQDHVQRLLFIRHARELGFSLDDIRELVALSAEPEQSCDIIDAVARRHLALVESRIDRLLRLKSELRRMIDQCKGQQVASCSILRIIDSHDFDAVAG